MQSRVLRPSAAVFPYDVTEAWMRFEAQGDVIGTGYRKPESAIVVPVLFFTNFFGPFGIECLCKLSA